MELIFKHFEAIFALINEQHYANLGYWLDAKDSIKDCTIQIIDYQEDQNKLKIYRSYLAFGIDISIRYMLISEGSTSIENQSQYYYLWTETRRLHGMLR